jgi:hypothetical protein
MSNFACVATWVIFKLIVLASPDALCINQNDLNERAQQVAIMAEIYAHAKTVVIWLGENYSDVDPAVENIYTIAKKLVPIWKAAQENETAEILSLRVMAFKADNTVRRLHWDSVAELLKRAWFQRVWCVLSFFSRPKIPCSPIILGVFRRSSMQRRHFSSLGEDLPSLNSLLSPLIILGRGNSTGSSLLQ